MKKIIFPIAALAILLTASCSKEKVAAPVEENNPSPVSTISGSGGKFNSLQLNSGMREWVASVERCSSVSENCHPEDIIITGFQKAELMSAIAGGGLGVRDLFSDEDKALTFVPEWNSEWFSDVKTAILSGGYTFVQAGTSTFLLGKVGVVDTENFDYVLSYAE